MSKTSKYRGVCYAPIRSGNMGTIRWSQDHPWTAAIRFGGSASKRSKKKLFATEREAAIQYDKWVLELGLDRPLNILKPKAR